MKRKINIKEALNAALVGLVGKSLVKQWWKTPNKAFDGKTPISLTQVGILNSIPRKGGIIFTVQGNVAHLNDKM